MYHFKLNTACFYLKGTVHSADRVLQLRVIIAMNGEYLSALDLLVSLFRRETLNCLWSCMNLRNFI